MKTVFIKKPSSVISRHPVKLVDPEMRVVGMKSMPTHIVVLDLWNYAGIGERLSDALKLRFAVDYVYIGRVKQSCYRESIDRLLKLPLNDDALMLFVEPSRINYLPDVPFDSFLYPALQNKIPFGVYWCGTVCRVTPYDLQYKISDAHKKNVADRRDYIDSLTPLRLCSTEDLMNVGAGHSFIGAPFPFPLDIPKKDASKHMIIHTPSKLLITNIYKGTGKIQRAFDMLGDKYNTEVVSYGTSHNDLMCKMKRATMYVSTMTDWEYGIGYAGIEAMANGCLVFSKTPQVMKSEIIHVDNPKHLSDMIIKFAGDKDLYETTRAKQFNWAKSVFSPESFANSVYREIKNVVESGWK